MLSTPTMNCWCCSVTKSCPALWNPVCCSPPAPLSTGLPRQEYWSGLPCPFPGDLPDLGIKPVCPALAGGFFTTEPPGKPHTFCNTNVVSVREENVAVLCVTEVVSHQLPLTAAVVRRPGASKGEWDAQTRPSDGVKGREGRRHRTRAVLPPASAGCPQMHLWEAIQGHRRAGELGGPQDGGKLIGHTRRNLSPELITAVTTNWVSLRRVANAATLAGIYDYWTATHAWVTRPPHRACS